MVIEMGSTLLYVMTHGFDEWRPHELQWISSGRVVKINSIDTATPESDATWFHHFFQKMDSHVSCR